MTLETLENGIENIGNGFGNIGKWHWEPENDNFRYMKHWKMYLIIGIINSH